MRRLSDSSSFALFVFGAYLISWSIWMFAGRFHNTLLHAWIGSLDFSFPANSGILLLGNVGPGLSATLVVGFIQGWSGVRRLWSGLTVWKLKGAWIAFVCLLMPLLCSVALFAYWLLGGRLVGMGNPARWLLLIVVNLPFAPLWEEVGWRGFLLPRLQATHSGLIASMLLAGIWAPWHLPLYWKSSVEYLIWYFVMVFALAVIFTWVYNRSQGSLVPVILLHVMVNTTSMYMLGPTMRSFGTGSFRFFAGSIVCAALVIVLVVGPSLAQNSFGEIDYPKGSTI
jgi:membrane protease YdiL (CAAX protease family)